MTGCRVRKTKKTKDMEERGRHGQRKCDRIKRGREGVHLICIHYMLPDNKLQFNPRRGGSHSVVINK